MDPTRFVRCPKREMGHDSLPLGGGLTAVSDVIAAVLHAVRREVEREFGGVPARVVLTRPVQWARTRREMFEDAVRAGGFTGAEFLEEPVAAAVRLASLEQLPGGAPFAVLDFGGGTLDVAVVERAGPDFDVLTSDGADPLGGEDIDDLLFSYVVATAADRKVATQLADSSDPDWRRQRDVLRTSCRLAKEQLSEQDHGDIDVPHTNEAVVLSRQQFDGLAGPVLQRAAGTLQEAVRESGFDVSVVPVYLVGGSSRIPGLAEIIRAQMNCPVRAIGDPQFVVSEGAALWGSRRSAGQQGPPLDRFRDRYPDQWAAAEEASRRATELLRVAQQRAVEAGEKARVAVGKAGSTAKTAPHRRSPSADKPSGGTGSSPKPKQPKKATPAPGRRPASAKAAQPKPAPASAPPAPAASSSGGPGLGTVLVVLVLLIVLAVLLF
jgi:Ethanolamine utilization protein EutJ (predicted chaperonin)